MSFESDLYAELSGDAGVTALVSDRIYPSHFGGDPVAPYIIYTPIFNESLYDLSGSGDQSRVRLQVDCYSEDVDEAAAIARAVISAIPTTISTPGASGICRTAHNNQDLGLEEDTRLYRRLVEFTIFHRS